MMHTQDVLKSFGRIGMVIGAFLEVCDFYQNQGMPLQEFLQLCERHWLEVEKFRKNQQQSNLQNGSESAETPQKSTNAPLGLSQLDWVDEITMEGK